MNTKVVNMSDKAAISKAQDCLNAGGVVGIPTDTVYGIACRVDQEKSISRLYEIKKRDQLKAIPVLVSSRTQVGSLSNNLSTSIEKLMDAFWPGALTIIMPKNPSLPKMLTQYPTVGVRMPNHLWLNHLMDVCGPLAATSANISGQPSLSTPDDVLTALDGRIDLLIDGGRCEGGIASTVVDCTGKEVHILRQGAISEKDIHSALK